MRADTMERALFPAVIRVVIADDHDILRCGVKAVLDTAPDVQVVGEARDGAELLEVVAALLPDVVLVDIGMPVMDGIAAIGEIHRRHPALLLLVLSMDDSPLTIRRAVAAGAAGYLMKDAPACELAPSLRTLVANGSCFSPAISRLLRSPAAHMQDNDGLTERQTQVLTRIAQGRASREIACELGLSPKTVDVHRSRIMERLRLKDVASLTRYAVRNGLIEP